MDFLCSNFRNLPIKTQQPLAYANQIRKEIKLAQGKIYKTSPAALIEKLYKPVRFRRLDQVVRCVQKRVPFVDDAWTKLQTTPEEWCRVLLQKTFGTWSDDVTLSPVELIERQKYPVEVYKDVETEDGYLLGMFRIPHGKSNKNVGVKPVVFLMHGLLSSSADFVLTGPGRGLAYLLADRGYDVWMGNPRGTRYSRKHIKYNPDTDEDYWKFSFHEIGVYDLPAMINVILEITNCKTLSYIGTSQGASAFYVLTSELPEYNRYFNLMLALAPAVYLSNISSPIVKFMLKIQGVLWPFATKTGLFEFPPRQLSPAIQFLRQKGYAEGIFQDVVVQLVFLVCGHSYDQLKREDLPMILSNVPHTASIYQLRHFGQNAVSGTFRKFDHGEDVNLQKYGVRQPPAYDLSKVTTPVALYYSNGDYLSHPRDVLRLYNELPNCVSLYKVKNETFNHIDFVYATNVVKLLYNHVFETLEKYNEHSV